MQLRSQHLVALLLCSAVTVGCGNEATPSSTAASSASPTASATSAAPSASAADPGDDIGYVQSAQLAFSGGLSGTAAVTELVTDDGRLCGVDQGNLSVNLEALPLNDGVVRVYIYLDGLRGPARYALTGEAGSTIKLVSDQGSRGSWSSRPDAKSTITLGADRKTLEVDADLPLQPGNPSSIPSVKITGTIVCSQPLV